MYIRFPYWHILEIRLPRSRADRRTTRSDRAAIHRRLRVRYVVRWAGIGKGGLNF